MAYVTVAEQAAFDKAEQNERDLMVQLFKKYNINEYSFTPIGSKAEYDGEYTTKKGEKIIFEVKSRRFNSDRYATTVLEDHKIQYLLKKGREENKKIYVFFFFEDAKVYIHQLKQTDTYEIKPTLSTKSTYGKYQEDIRAFIYLPINLNNLKQYK